MEIYTIIKIAAQKDGNGIVATTEKAYQSAQQAQAYLQSVPVVWDEVIFGMECTCERAIHTTILE